MSPDAVVCYRGLQADRIIHKGTTAPEIKLAAVTPFVAFPLQIQPCIDGREPFVCILFW